MTSEQFLAEWTFRSGIIIATGAALLWVLRLKNPSVKLAAWTAILCASLLLPLLGNGLPKISLRIMPAATLPVPGAFDPRSTLAQPPMASGEPLAMMQRAVQPTPTTPKPTNPAPFDWMSLAIITYSAVAAALLMRLLFGIVVARRLLRRSRATGRTYNGIEVRESQAVLSPVAMGFAPSVIVLPAEWRTWDEAKLNAVLAHERSHVRRRDPIVQAIAAFHRALLWHSPLSWVLHWQLVRLAEEASDDAAVAATQDRAGYAETLLAFMNRGVRRVSWQGVAMARYGRPETRIDRILDGTGMPRGVTRGSLATIIILAAPLACLVAATRPEARQAVVSGSNARPAVASAASSTAEPVQAASAPQPAGSTAPAPVVSTPVVEATVPQPLTPPQAATPSQASSPSQPSPPPQPTPPPAANTTIRRYMVVDADSISESWDSSDPENQEALRGKFGRHFAWFRMNGNEYVITDAGVLEELRKANEPQKEVNRMQEDVNAHQAVVNGMQADVNAQQGKVNEMQHQVNLRQDIANRVQSSVNKDDKEAMIQKLQQGINDLKSGRADADQNSVNLQQAKVNEAQHAVNAKQAEVNELQHKVNEAQQRVNTEYRRRIQEIFQSAVSKGLAQQLM